MDKWIRLVITVLVVLLPILDIYQILPNITFGRMLFVGLMPIMIIPIILRNKGIKFPKYYLIFLVFAVSLNLIHSDIGDIKTILIYSLILGFSCQYLDLKFAIAFYRKIVYVICCIFIVQFIIFHTSGIIISGIVPFVGLSNGVDTASFINSTMNVDRPSSIFMEPAHFAQYLLPYLSLVIFKKNKTAFRINKEAILFTLIMLLINSGNGIIGIIILWLIWTIITLKNLTTLKRILVLILVPAIILFIAIIYLTTFSGSKLLERTTEVTDSNQTEMTSGYIRIYRGYLIYGKMPIQNKILGGGKREVDIFLNNTGFATDLEQYNYFNGIQTLLIYTGILGLIIFFMHLALLLFDNRIEGKGIILILMTLSFFASIYLSSLMLFYIIFAFAFQKQHIIDQQSNLLGNVR